MAEISLSDSYSQPFGRSQMYGRPPYFYRGTRTITVLYTVDGEGLDGLLPPGVELADENPVVSVTVTHNVDSAFGPYDEMWFYVRVTFEGETFMFNPLMYVTADSSMACGREVWGFPKKLATVQWNELDDGFAVVGSRPSTERLLDLRFVPGEPAGESRLAEVGHPSLTLRLIPNYRGHGEPDLAQLISTVTPRRILLDDDGKERFWRGTAEVTVGKGTDQDPFGLFAPVELLDAWMSYSDFEIPAGVLVHDYKKAAA